MVRKSPRHPKTSHATTPLSIIRVDGARIRQQIKREYEKVRRDLKKAQEQLEHFQHHDLPGFNRWISRQFGPLLTELRETGQRLREAEQLVLEIETERFYSGASQRQAYARVMNRRKNPEPPPEATEEEADSSRAGPNGENHSSHSRPGFEDAESIFDDFAEFFGFGGKGKAPRPGSTSKSIMGRLKDLYRALARRLHPDTQKKMTPQKQEWWHQAQAAYETGDVEQLEVILSLCEIEDTGNTDKTSLSVLQRISAELKRSLRQIKSQLSKHRREPAWNFTQRTDVEELDAIMRRELNHDLRIMKEKLQVMESHIAALASQSQRRRAPRRRRGPISDPFDLFF